MMSPGLMIFPKVIVAAKSGLRSGCFASLIGVGTVTIWKSARRRSSAFEVNWMSAAFRSFESTSPVLSILLRRSVRRVSLISKPITLAIFPELVTALPEAVYGS